ncbi:tRNA pseudouridine(55) synthase TruB [Sphingobacterium hotanense]|uniref:tRNA pseudouridine(55) synthase TruB n=1 Tax=Sphingobacterium hotanense TaxID=649196 RepID=UPI0011F3A50D|nr:tRNA pseudouridine(55) synthase TruB [Sphingobacterium hotanense]
MENTSKLKEHTDFNFAQGELLLIDKPLTWTSFDVVGKLRNSLKPLKLKVGHAGTLDPLATGLLIVCTGKMTKQIDTFQAEDKEYIGTVTIGATTPSYDLETEIENTSDISHISEQQVHEVAATFLGEQEQYPPAHSAIKIGGERVYEKARRGEEVELKARKVNISAFEIVDVEFPIVHFRIRCSKGTYIRSIANDFGVKLGVGAHLSSLRRTKSGDFDVNNAWELTELIAIIQKNKSLELHK